jgi:hypothetical protein
MAISLNSISRTTAAKAPVVVAYGEAGIGKTTFAAGANKPIFIFTEDGAGSLEVDAFPRPKTFGEVMDAIQVLYEEEHDYETFVLDSLDHLEVLIWAQVCEDHNVGSIEKMPYGRGYTEALPYWRQFLDGCRALRDDKGMAIILIAHHQIKRFESPEHDAIDRFGIKLHAKASALVEESADIVGFAKLRVHVRKEDLGFGNTRTRAVTTGERVLMVSGTPAAIAKNRFNLPQEIPLSWQSLCDAIAAGKAAA